MQTADPLAQLRDIHLPEPVGFWPLAPGWWLLAGLALVVCTVLFLRWKKHRPYRLAKKAALYELEQLGNNASASEINSLLKRTAISLGYSQCKSLHGKDWLVFLDNTNRKKSLFVKEAPEFAEAPYNSLVDIDAEKLKTLASHWIRNARHV